MTLTSRFKTLLVRKIWMTIFLMVVATFPYYFTQKVAWFPLHVLTPGWLESHIPFSPDWGWVYCSLYLLIPTPAYLLVHGKDLIRYACGMIFMAYLASTVFLFWPTEYPRPIVPYSSWIYDVIVFMDAPRNAFPSLHAAFIIFSLGTLERTCAEYRHPWRLRLILWSWALLILYSTLATRQHLLMDLVAGAVLGGVIVFLVYGKLLFVSKNNPNLIPPNQTSYESLP